ncbi:Alpha-galactosidase precursor [Burkholderia singularis]|uniref:Alpha-galactosidase n=2 Tax=Burkholderia singularis TaxID=1503053 RepID=A0A238H1F4_9BURK|nr:Alpha-galactosidase precursor [Burkholderia singularis]
MRLARIKNTAGAWSTVLTIGLCGVVSVSCATPPSAAAPGQTAHVAAPMGWSSWNSLEENVSFDTIKAQADGMVRLNRAIESGAKYEYVNIDEGWWTSGQRDANGNFIVDTRQWPGGMRAIAQYIHSQGLKAGIYIDAGPLGCGFRRDGTRFVGSDVAHYRTDFLQFAQWGFDFVKVDFCGGRDAGYDPQQAYTAIAAAIDDAYAKTGQRLMLSICDWGTIGSDRAFPDYNRGPWDWAPGVGRMWRTTDDIYKHDIGATQFARVIRNFNGNDWPEAQHTGYYNDPDMMIAGMGMSAPQDRAHVSLWAIAGAPLILGNDLSKPLAADTLGLLTNPEVIAIDQDPLGLQGLKVAQSRDGTRQVWAKLLAGNGQRAVVLFNNSNTDAPMTFTWTQLGLAPAERATVRDVWARQDLGVATQSYTVPLVPAGGAVMLRVDERDATEESKRLDAFGGGIDESRMHCNSCDGGEDSDDGEDNASQRHRHATIRAHVKSHTTGGYIEIAYANPHNETRYAQLAVNGGTPTTLAFEPTSGAARTGAVIVYAGLKPGMNQIALSNVDTTKPMPGIRSVASVAGPVRLPTARPAYEAVAHANTLAGAARVQVCAGCASGQAVGQLGNGGTLTINRLAVPADGAYSVQIVFVNGDSVDRVAQISFNGAAPVPVTFPTTGNWATPSTLTVHGVLRAGRANTLTFSNPSAPAPAINGIDISAPQ